MLTLATCTVAHYPWYKEKEEKQKHHIFPLALNHHFTGLCPYSVTQQPWFTMQHSLTCRGAVVGDVAGHVDGFVVDPEVSHAAHEVSVPDGEVLGQVGNAA